MSLSEPVAYVIGSILVGGGTWAAGRGVKAKRSGMERLVASVTEDASEEYRKQAERMETQYKAELGRSDRSHKEEIGRLEKQLRWYQDQLKGGPR